MRDWRSSLQSKSMRNIVLGMCLVNVVGMYGAHLQLNEEVVPQPFTARIPVQVGYAGDDLFLSRSLPPVRLKGPSDRSDAEDMEAGMELAIRLPEVPPSPTITVEDDVQARALTRPASRMAVAMTPVPQPVQQQPASTAFFDEFADQVEPSVQTIMPLSPLAGDGLELVPLEITADAPSLDHAPVPDQAMPLEPSTHDVDFAPSDAGSPLEPTAAAPTGAELPAISIGVLPEVSIAAETPPA